MCARLDQLNLAQLAGLLGWFPRHAVKGVGLWSSSLSSGSVSQILQWNSDGPTTLNDDDDDDDDDVADGRWNSNPLSVALRSMLSTEQQVLSIDPSMQREYTEGANGISGLKICVGWIGRWGLNREKWRFVSLWSFFSCWIYSFLVFSEVWRQDLKI